MASVSSTTAGTGRSGGPALGGRPGTGTTGGRAGAVGARGYRPGRRVMAVAGAGLLTAGLAGCSGSIPGGSGSTSAGGTGSPTASAPRALPDEVGKGLKYAVDAVRTAGFGSFSTHDSTGRLRAQLLYTDWKVCFQTPRGGTHPVSVKVDFGVVKLAESCPATDQGLVTVTAGATMPDLVGRSARYADDVLGSKASIRYTTTTGKDAIVLVDSNWQVCRQTPAAGAPYAGVPVTLVVAKYSDGGCPKG